MNLSLLKSYLKNKSELFKLFFLSLKIFYILSAISICIFLRDGLILFPIVATGLILIVFQFIATVMAERLIKAGNQLGLFIGVILALMSITSIVFPLGFFGFYALFNKHFRSTYLLQQRPLWLHSFYENLDKWFSITHPENL